MYKEEIQKLEILVEEKRREFSQATGRLHDFRRQQLSHETGVVVGDKISWIDGRKTITGVVYDFRVRYGGAYVIANPFNKDGKVLIRQMSIINPATIKKLD